MQYGKGTRGVDEWMHACDELLHLDQMELIIDETVHHI